MASARVTAQCFSYGQAIGMAATSTRKTDATETHNRSKSAKFADLIRRWAPEMLAPYRRQISGTADIASRLVSTECR